MTTLQLQNDFTKELQRIQAVRKKMVNDYNFGRIKTWIDVYRLVGITQQELEYVGWTEEQLGQKPSRKEAMALINKQEQDIYAQQRSAEWDKANAGTVGVLGFDRMVGNKVDANETGQKPSGLSDDGVTASNKISDEKNKGSKATTSLPLSWTPATQHPLQKAKLWAKQEEAAAKAYDGIVTHKYRGQLLQAATGCGKTFVLGAIVRRLYDNKWASLQHCVSPWPIVYVTKTSIVEQTERVLKDYFGLDIVNQIKVINIEMLRASFGEMFIEWTTLVEGGNDIERPVWHPGLHPILFIWDECHILKNTDSLQSLVAQDVNNIERRYNKGNGNDVEVYQLFSSATPFTRVCEAKCFAVATHCSISDFNLAAKKIPLTNELWSGWAKGIAAPADPDEHSPGAIERLITYMMPYIVDIKGLRPQFHPNNHVEVIDFETDVAEQQYAKAWQDYLTAKAELEQQEMLSGSEVGMMVLAQFTILRKKAEWIRAPGIAARMMEAHAKGYASVGAFCFKVGITRAVMELIETHHIPRHRISLIWGGANPASKAKMKKVRQKFSDKMTPEEQQKFIMAMQEVGMDANEISELLDDTVGWEEKAVEQKDTLGYETYDKAKLEAYTLGPQSKKARQEEIDRFQSGHSWFCFFTFKAGGVGLSLHHSDELTTQKVTKHPNGDWALESSIPLIPVKPRKTFVTPTFSAIELVQGLGRAARLTSLSDTEQILLFYRGTIEERVAYIVSTKLKCLRKVVRQKESWEPMILNASKDDDVSAVPKQISETQPNNNNNNGQADNDDEDSVFVSETPDED